MSVSKKVALLVIPSLRPQIFTAGALQQLYAVADVATLQSENPQEQELLELLEGAVACITGWSTPTLTDTMLDQCPHLRLVAHTAGTIHHLIPDSFFERGLRITHSNSALAEGVAEFTVLQALLCSTRLHEFDRAIHAAHPQWHPIPPGRLLSAQVFGIVSASTIGREVIKRLRPFGCRIQVYDPFLSDTAAQELGVSKVDLETLFATSDIVSLHTPLLPTTRGMIKATHFARMRDGAIFLNTARAGLVEEEALIAELKKGRIYAALDVYHQEPLPLESPLRNLPNVVLSPHIAALTRDTLFKQGQMMVDEVQRFLQGENLCYEISPSQLATMA
ncbi:phosphoglycerate dehydrogenase-like enzyme [Thermosporothrix hazakensis]|jgi:phosphoglycerate dehydrogenase-like enzyme|uniref:Phosphoglycerate dehydrogenase-like enzyme n=2 Tax=Thermosporothrix TaxID=768650 RepID=A0A326UAX2_THEHA|nr:hydroxyacid dehydrogenase [Thermosporothrix hazakensis]PZW32090.1 phosphoglycerate dehydrogenase-like enzyme [Thermosporothrix hazakensis]BBH91437.1 2-hydroxyacid dehydrogenase [Thermosporothrix sp. COM3]GCE49582.1 2-hydroxyacid dehydrogenase [Thermosporothrix hazakensis]